MDSSGSCLGVCYTGNHLYYSVHNSGEAPHLSHIGNIEFSFNIEEAIATVNSDGFSALQKALLDIKGEYNCTAIKMLYPANGECWTIVPRAVYEDASERESHISLLMYGVDRSRIETTWLPVNRTGSRLLLLRNRDNMHGYTQLLRPFPAIEYVSDFELGIDWQTHTSNNGSFMMINCQKNFISVSSFILGKLRGSVFIEYDHTADLPYLWSLHAERLSWLKGIYDECYVYGYTVQQCNELLSPFWTDLGNIHTLQSLKQMQVDARETTYGFQLENAFPAIIMSLNY